jgi:subtilisin family serine protease
MSATTARLTRFGPELSLLSRHIEGQAELPRAAGMSRSVLGGAEGEARIQDAITLKLVVDPAASARAFDWIKSYAREVPVWTGEIAVATLDTKLVSELGRFEWLRRAELGRPLSLRLDQARGVATGAATAIARHGLSGAGVVVGVIDTGVDWRHADFQAGGRSRVEFFGHATKPGGASIFSSFSQQDIDAELRTGPAKVPIGDPIGHGTHCASIAAGNGAASNGQYQGVAPQTTLMAVRSDGLYDEHIVWGIEQIFQRAGTRPAVISLSLGGHLGAHDGTTALERYVSNRSGPGRIIVAAAGNEATRGIHWSGELRPPAVLSIPFRARDENQQVVDVWISRDDDVDVSIVAPDGSLLGAEGQSHDTVFGRVETEWRQDADNRDYNLTVFLTGAGLGHLWRIQLAPRTVSHGLVHAWSLTASDSGQVFEGHADRRYSIGMPATADRVISVGSFVSRNSFETPNGPHATPALRIGDLSEFSSHGPTRHGLLKPDVAAPGQYVTAALASGSRYETSPRYKPRHHPNGAYLSIQGTSMSTPFVSGVVALMLQREPSLTPEAIARRLRVTCRRDAQTGRAWNPGFGHGRIDVEALLDFRE